MLTPKENYLKVLKGDVPEWIPTYTLAASPDSPFDCPSCLFEPSVINGHRVNNGGLDIWGVNYVGSAEAGGALIPEPDNFILDDITKWRDVIKAPDLSNVNWEELAKKDIAASGIDRSKTAVAYNLHMGYFQLLMSFMGFTEGLCAMYEEPDEVHALLEYLCDFYCDVAEKSIDYYKPEVFTMMDDTAAWAAPFISMDMFEEFLMPCYDRQAKFGRDRGLPITFHNCGKSMEFMEKLHTIGITAWDPAQTCNDLEGFKKKYGNEFVIMGGWDARDHLLADDVTDEEIYESVRDSVNRFAPGGGYVFCGAYLGALGDKEIIRKNKIVMGAIEEIGHNFYK